MIYKRPFRWLGVIIVMTLILAIIPATPALAWNDVTFSKTSATIGETITYTGLSFSPTIGSTTVYAIMYLSSQNTGIAGQYIGSNITTYSTVAQVPTSGTGTISGSITIPTKFSSNNANLTPGTHTLYVAESSNAALIVKTYTITILGNAAMSISPLTGLVDSTITITGTDFLASTVLTVTFDGTPVTPTSGAVTSATGAVAATIAVLESTAGVHTIVVSDGTSLLSATFTVTPDIIIAPQSGEAGTTVTISGAGFAYRTLTYIYFNNEEVASTITSPKGSIDMTFEIPDNDLTAGSYQVEADDGGTNLSTAPFTLIVAAQPTPTPTATTVPEVANINVSTSGDTIGSLIGIGGSGYAPNCPISITFDGDEITTVMAGSDGTFITQFQVPVAPGGDYVVAVSDNTVTKQFTYSIETTAPDVPPPLEPAMGVTIESPMTFDWDAVTDLSAPVTYELQVAGDNEFTADSVLIKVTALEGSSYLLTEAQELKLAGRAEPYFWRIRAVDAAANPSSWTGSGEFYISPPFSVPTWLIYTLAGVGAVIIFGIGYLVGRRTAFYY